MRFNTIGVSDGISMGTDGMSYSLPVARPDRRLDRDGHGRAVVRRAHRHPRLRQEHAGLRDGDGAAQPAVADGLRRHDPRRPRAAASRATSSRRSSRYGEYLAGTITDEQRLDIVAHACPGAGACGGMYTANTMAVGHRGAGHVAAVQLVDPGRRSRQGRRVPSRRRGDAHSARARPQAARHPDAARRSRTRWSMVMALGGSTNAVLHLIAMAQRGRRAADDRRLPARQRPRAAARRPQAERQVRAWKTCTRVGGTPAVMKYLLERGLPRTATA